jgi:hypothetical protein
MPGATRVRSGSSSVMTEAHTPIRVNRAPILTLWVAVVAERLGHPPGDCPQPRQRPMLAVVHRQP